MQGLLAFSRAIDTMNEKIGKAMSWLVLAAVIVSSVNASVRFSISKSSNAWLELQWYLFGAVVLLGAAYTLKHNEHIRIDIVNSRLSKRTRDWIDVIGHLFFLGPLCLIMLWLGVPFFLRAFASGEISASAGGLIVWPAKLLVPLGFFLLTLQGVSELIKRAEPTSRAKYVGFTTVAQPENMIGLRLPVLDWPYVEGLRMDEAMHPLTLLSFGLYGEVLPNQNGAPVRLVVPWKYGFKSIKSIVRITLTEAQPPTSWNVAAPNEYGFYANVNPKVDHPRWSQATEQRIGEVGRRKTLMFNGYADQVGEMYADLDLRRFF